MYHQHIFYKTFLSKEKIDIGSEMCKHLEWVTSGERECIFVSCKNRRLYG